MPIDLSDPEETCSLLVPAYEVTRAERETRPLGPEHLLGPARDESETFGLLRRDEFLVQPRGTANFMFGASALLNDAIGPVGGRWTIRLRETDRPMPAGRANVCLMVGGMRTSVRRHQGHSEFARGFAAWATPARTSEWVSQVGRSAEVPGGYRSKSVSFGRTGRCTLYAPIGGDKARILLLDFHVADRDDASPDLLFVSAACAETRLGDFPHQDPHGLRLSDDWRALVLDAIDGYRQQHGP